MATDTPDAHPDETATAIRQAVHHLEGYLFWEAETATAKRAAADFVQGFEWMTTGQREEVSFAFATAYLGLSRDAVYRIADRTRTIRDEYQEQARALRSRSAAVVSATVAVLSLADTLMLLR